MTRKAVVLVLALLLVGGLPRAQAQSRRELALTLGPMRVSTDARMAVDVRPTSDAVDETDPSGVDLARRRVGMRGALGEHLVFEVEREVGSRGGWRDAYVDLRPSRAFRVTAGRFKVPFSLEATTGAMHLDFVNRSRAATFLAPGRDDGVMVHGRVWAKRLEYEAGVFRHDGEGPSGRRPERTFGRATSVARLSVRPLVQGLRGAGDLRVAMAATRSQVPEGVSNLRGRTTSGRTFFPASHWVAGERSRFGLEALWKTTPVSVSAEYMRAVDERQGQGVAGDDLPSLVARGWYAAGIWRLPPHTLGWRQARLEVTGRVEALVFRSASLIGPAGISPRAVSIAPVGDRVFTLGLNLWITGHVKALFNISHERTDSLTGDPGNADRAWRPVLRLQVGL